MTPTGPNRLKGAATLSAWQPTGDAPARLESGVLLGEGDVLQFTVTTTRSHLALLGVDGTELSRVTCPWAETRSVRAREQPSAADALVLDDASGPVFAFLSTSLSSKTLSVRCVLERAGAAPWQSGTGPTSSATST